ncbi:hypothetical protein C7410_115190 [Paraburkholderia silvatlantica]|uniref:Uncharacterized protein n=1 Tax=Paraburkholderia silvatlantica TaxID=321895 RepID=A0A2V4UAG4_9BURK|nr:hypothetical protein [Paraburkholderia silvatlantica]PYE21347.1 hypothetical protein C7410_115190 [Paraburkholderia silvatlantica]
MNIRDVAGVATPAELYELASKFGLHVGSMDQLVRFAVEIQRRFLVSHEGVSALSAYIKREEA